ncbi:alkaline phosphatase family protein [Sandarakinorhabdus oryzae]|uniref:alkaline phosphatase family protein n=1 Tax=Sandarakinorhabdus oryzae TaxID=2675220 RepID=UPI001F2B9C01|nr:ectonucleotide pyrophosphatase/phosphodiesterase [Sandarakinorhabdus oryzae]
MTILRAFAVAAALLLAACSGRPPPATLATAAQPAHPVILISVDGLRADYLQRGLTPNISGLAARGVTTRAMRPSFPSLTFPNHYTLVTGLRPDHHGLVNNKMQDAMLGRFTMANRSAVEDARWWNGGEPIWVTAERAGITTATMFWPGSEAAIRGIRPHRWLPFDGAMPGPVRVDQLLAWLDETPRPGLATLYFDTVDHDGHEFGPDSPQLNAALAAVDAQIGRLLAGLAARGIEANIVLVADHGMATVSTDHRIFLDSLLDPAAIELVGDGALATLNPLPGQEAAVKAALLRPHPHMACHEKARLPARFHYGQHPRVPAILCLADVGWMIWLRPPPAGQAQGQAMRALGGMHGFDPAAPEMAASFVAAGPAFRSGVVLPPFDNVDVHPLLLRLLGLPPMQTDGDSRTLGKALR